MATHDKLNPPPEYDLSRPWLPHYPNWTPDRLAYPQQPVWWLLDQAATLHPSRIACCYFNQRLTYAELNTAAQRTAADLVHLGVRAGDRVGLLLPNVPEYLAAAYGVWMAGAVVVAMNPLMTTQEISGLAIATNCRTVISLDLLASLVMHGQSQPDNLLLVCIKNRLPHFQRVAYSAARWRRMRRWSRNTQANIRSFDDHFDVAALTFSPVHSMPNEPAYILPTGGTTGSPKAVTLSHKNLIANAWQLVHWTDNRMGDESMLAVVPFFHSYGLSTCVTTGVATATTMILYHRFKPKPVADLIRKYRPTCFPAVPSMMYALNESFREQPIDGKAIDYCIAGGAKLDASIADQFAEHTGSMVVEGYGLSEASPVTHVGPLNGTAHAGTIGMPLPDTEARIVDGQSGTGNLGPGQVGELVIRGPQVMLGYWRDPDKTKEVIRDGWLYTGDLASYDERGCFRIVDRKKDLIITSGRNVYPDDVESVLRRFSGVIDVAVVGTPDAQRGEVVKAFLVVQQKNQFDAKGFDRFVRDNLAKYKQPREVEVLDTDLPRNFLGKVLRRKLR